MTPQLLEVEPSAHRFNSSTLLWRELKEDYWKELITHCQYLQHKLGSCDT